MLVFSFSLQVYISTCLEFDSVSMETAKLPVRNSLVIQTHSIFSPNVAKNKHNTGNITKTQR